MKRLFLRLAVLALGLAVGGGGAYTAANVFGPLERGMASKAFVPTGPVLAPLVLKDGRLSGYVSFEVELQVPANRVDFVKARMPLLLHAINMRTYRSPLASGPDGMLPDVEQFRKVVIAAAAEAFGDEIVRRAVITQAVPA